jgi:FtsP/CotA-like multicopper oxidase with cupredoxin domain
MADSGNGVQSAKPTCLFALLQSPRVALIVLLAGLAVGVFGWLRLQGFIQQPKPIAGVPEVSPAQIQEAYDRLTREQSAKISHYIKPTVTAEMGDLGGKYFGLVPDPAKTRHYYIAAEPVEWDYVPSGSDPVCGVPLPPDVIMRHKFWKMRYIQYTDATFTTRVSQLPRLGILGPVLRGVTGEYLAVTFYNRLMDTPLSMHPHGVKYDKDSEGSYHSDAADVARQVQKNGGEPFQGRGAALGYNAKFTYVWYLDEQSGPRPSEPSSKGWLYHSHVSSQTEANMGLEGFIIVTDPKRARPDGTPNDVDREMAALFMIFDESGIGREAREMAAMPTDVSQISHWIAVQTALEAGERYALNGYIFGNLPGLDINEGEHVRWYLFGLGSEKDLHTAHWHGLRVADETGRRTDSIELIPASMKIADMLAENPGDWLLHCHVEEHMAEGMFARVAVHPKDKPGASRAPEQAFFGLEKPK